MGSCCSAGNADEEAQRASREDEFTLTGPAWRQQLALSQRERRPAPFLGLHPEVSDKVRLAGSTRYGAHSRYSYYARSWQGGSSRAAPAISGRTYCLEPQGQ